MMSSEVPFETFEEQQQLTTSSEKWKEWILAWCTPKRLPILAVFCVAVLTSIVAMAVTGTPDLYTLVRHEVKIGVYYYPWHSSHFNGDGSGYLRGQLDPPQSPKLGEYTDQDSDIISIHLDWSKRANIKVWALSWWGPGDATDTTCLNYILSHDNLEDIELAIHYETWGRTGGLAYLDNVYEDFSYLAEYYFGHANYLKIDGRPVVFLYAVSSLFAYGKLDEFTSLARQAAAGFGYDIYIVGDAAYGDPVILSVFLYSWMQNGIGLVDAVTSYDVYGNMRTSGYAGRTAVNRFYKQQNKWRSMSHKAGKDFIPTITPGYNDKGVRDGNDPLSRKLTRRSAFGSLFTAMLRKFPRLTDESTGKLMMITSFNEWHEDTQIEPVAYSSGNTTAVDVSSSGQLFTNGLEYEAYGERYLDILQQYTS